ncbi:MAG TPA: class I SAM-dependent methyltransferase [Actinomycetota bacterium]|nr:class I SAM-dependent methyltransferase [Actinomycetota bacterium]
MTNYRQIVGELTLSTWALSALCASMEAGIVRELRQVSSPEGIASDIGIPLPIVESLLDVLRALGLARREGAGFVADAELAAIPNWESATLSAAMHSALLQGAQTVQRARSRTLTSGWTYSDPELLQAQGTFSTGVVPAWTTQVIPTLEGLKNELQKPGAAFLDVGTGVASIAIAMCRHFPDLQVVGIDPHEPALVEGRKNVEKAGLANRIDLRRIGVEAMQEESTFTLANLPVLFLPTDVLQSGLRAVFTALRPGGWLIAQVPPTSGDTLAPSLFRLACALCGSRPLSPEEVKLMLHRTGYIQTAILPPLSGPFVRYVVARRPEPQ